MTTPNTVLAPATAARPGRLPALLRHGTTRYLVQRFLLMFPTVFILVSVVFFLMHAIGNPITAALGGTQIPASRLHALIHAAGYDRPLIVQYLDYLGQIARFDFGTTVSDHEPVLQVIATYGGATAELVFYSLIVAVVIGFALGMFAARSRESAADGALRAVSIALYATPVFFSGLIVKLIFGVWLGVLPVSGRVSTLTQIDLSALSTPSGINTIDVLRAGDPAGLGDVLAHAVLPAITLGGMIASVFFRLVRNSMTTTLNAGYIEAARSRGVSELRLTSRDAFRPAFGPIITVVGMQVAMLLGGAVLTETTFDWRGLGYQLAQYISARDYVAVQGIVAFIAVVVTLTNFLVDLVMILVDPRVRH